MFTNIPVEETIMIMEDSAFKNKELLLKQKMDNNELINIIDLITKNTYFKHRNKIFQQVEGFPMGSPLSGTLGNIFMNHFESKLLEKSKYKMEYYRYADDILIIWFGTIRQFNKFFAEINKRKKDIHFKMEKEVNDSLNFLDLCLIRKENKLMLKRYKKEYMSDHIMNFESGHDISIKINVIENYLQIIYKSTSNEI